MTVAYGLAAVDAVRDEYDTITPLPVTARWAWLRTWATQFADRRPAVVRVDGGIGLLAVRRKGPLTVVTLLGHGQSDYAALPARDPAGLADEITFFLDGLLGPWRLRFDQVPAGDPVVAELGKRLRHSEVSPGDGAPAIRFDERRTSGEYAHHRLRKQVRRCWRRLDADGLKPVIDVVRGTDVAAVLPEVATVHVARDRAARGSTEHDDPAAAAFWRAVLLDCATRDEVDVTTFRIEGEIASYAICLRDGTAARLWDSKHRERWSRYSVGRLADHCAIDRMLAEGGWTEFDRMRGVEPYKMQTATDVVPYQRLTAWSSPLLRRAESVARSARRRGADEDGARES